MKYTTEVIDGEEWVVGENRNRASVAHYNTREKAIEVLETLEGCKNCTDCHYCSDCNDCNRCYDCSDCTNCKSCISCYRCIVCIGCKDCFDCIGCKECFDCFDCKDCSVCFDCKDCDRCYELSNHKHKTDLAAEGVEITIPSTEDIHSKVYAAASITGALDMCTWHTCETTHCRAGWVVHLAGEAGRALEKATTCEFAATQIYKASGYEISPDRFYDTEKESLKDMRELAEAELVGK